MVKFTSINVNKLVLDTSYSKIPMYIKVIVNIKVRTKFM